MLSASKNYNQETLKESEEQVSPKNLIAAINSAVNHYYVEKGVDGPNNKRGVFDDYFEKNAQNQFCLKEESIVDFTLIELIAYIESICAALEEAQVANSRWYWPQGAGLRLAIIQAMGVFKAKVVVEYLMIKENFKKLITDVEQHCTYEKWIEMQENLNASIKEMLETQINFYQIESPSLFSIGLHDNTIDCQAKIIRKHLDELNKQIELIKSKLESLPAQEERSDLGLNQLSISTLIVKYSETYDQLVKVLQNFVNEKKASALKIEELIEEKQALDLELKELKEIKESKELKEKNQEVEQLTKECAKLKDTHQQLSLGYQQLETKSNQYKSDIDKVNQELENLKNLKAENAQLKEENKRLLANQNQQRQQSEDGKDQEIKALGAEIGALKNGKKDDEETIKRLNNQVDHLNNVIEGLQTKVTELTVTIDVLIAKATTVLREVSFILEVVKEVLLEFSQEKYANDSRTQYKKLELEKSLNSPNKDKMLQGICAGSQIQRNWYTPGFFETETTKKLKLKCQENKQTYQAVFTCP